MESGQYSNDYVLLLQKTTELNVRVNNIETTIQNSSHHTNRALTDLRDELIRNTANVERIVENIAGAVAMSRESTEVKIARAIEDNNKLLTAKFASSEQLSGLVSKIDRLSTKITIVGGVITVIAMLLVWVVEHPQLLQQIISR